jgi:hypothetical protein
MVHADGISAFHICHKDTYLGLLSDCSLLVHRVYGVPVEVVDRELIVGVSQKDFHLVVRVGRLYNNRMSIRRAMVLVKELLTESLQGFTHNIACDHDVRDLRVGFVDFTSIE